MKTMSRFTSFTARVIVKENNKWDEMKQGGELGGTTLLIWGRARRWQDPIKAFPAGIVLHGVEILFCRTSWHVEKGEEPFLVDLTHSSVQEEKRALTES